MCGNPPFETLDLKETYKCIKEVRYNLPSTLSPAAQKLISGILQKNPSDRLTLDQILNHEFFKVCWPSGNFLPVLRNTVVTFFSRGEGVWKCQCLICYLNWEQSGHAPTSSLFLTVFFFFNASPLPLSQGFTPDKLPPSSCTMVPELHPPSPAKKFFTKMAKSLFGKKKAKGEQAAWAMGGGVSFSDLVLRISKSCCIYLNSPAFKHICCDYSVSCFHSGKNSMRGQRGQGYFQAGVGHR